MSRGLSNVRWFIRYQMALELYSAKFNGKSFPYLGAWKVLKDSPKFCSTPSKKRSLSPGKLKSMKVEMDPTPSSTAVSSSSSADSQAADCKLFVEENKSGMKEVILLKRVSVSFSEDTCCCRDPWVPKRPKSCKPWQTHALRATKS